MFNLSLLLPLTTENRLFLSLTSTSTNRYNELSAVLIKHPATPQLFLYTHAVPSIDGTNPQPPFTDGSLDTNLSDTVSPSS
jgi:hypothetical protein